MCTFVWIKVALIFHAQVQEVSLSFAMNFPMLTALSENRGRCDIYMDLIN